MEKEIIITTTCLKIITLKDSTIVTNLLLSSSGPKPTHKLPLFSIFFFIEFFLLILFPFFYCLIVVVATAPSDILFKYLLVLCCIKASKQKIYTHKFNPVKAETTNKCNHVLSFISSIILY